MGSRSKKGLYEVRREYNGRGLQARIDFNRGIKGLVQGLQEEDYSANLIEGESQEEVCTYGLLITHPSLKSEHIKMIRTANYKIEKITQQACNESIRAISIIRNRLIKISRYTQRR